MVERLNAHTDDAVKLTIDLSNPITSKTSPYLNIKYFKTIITTILKYKITYGLLKFSLYDRAIGLNAPRSLEIE